MHFGTTPTVSAFLISIPIGMVAYTGIETISNMAEEARDPARDVPRSIGLVAAAVFAIYAFLPAVALSAMPMHETPALSHPPGTDGTHYWTALGAKYAGDPVQGIVQNLGLGPLTTPVSYYVGLLAGTILIIATNAGLIGVSRLTYSMGVHRQFPDFLRTVHPTWRTPWVAIVVYTFAAIGMIGAAKVAGGQGVAFLGNLYAFGAMLSFTIAHASVIALRVRKSKRDPEQPFRAPLNIRVGELDIPLFAVLGGLGTFAAFVVVASLFPAVRWAGLSWLALGMLVYVAYRPARRGHAVGLFVPRYAEAALGHIGQMSGRSAELIGVGVIAVLGIGRLLPQFSRVDFVRPLALVDMLAQLTLACSACRLGHIDVLTSSVDLGRRRPGHRSATRSRSRWWPSRARDRGRAVAGGGRSRATAAPHHDRRHRRHGARLRRDRGLRAVADAGPPRPGDAIGLRQRPLDGLGHGAARRGLAGHRHAGLRLGLWRRRARARQRQRDRRPRTSAAIALGAALRTLRALPRWARCLRRSCAARAVLGRALGDGLLVV